MYPTRGSRRKFPPGASCLHPAPETSRRCERIPGTPAPTSFSHGENSPIPPRTAPRKQTDSATTRTETGRQDRPSPLPAGNPKPDRHSDAAPCDDRCPDRHRIAARSPERVPDTGCSLATNPTVSEVPEPATSDDKSSPFLSRTVPFHALRPIRTVRNSEPPVHGDAAFHLSSRESDTGQRAIEKNIPHGIFGDIPYLCTALGTGLPPHDRVPYTRILSIPLSGQKHL